jgi:peptidoglycan/LPS O-acetylase OafA/YrhL
VNADPRTFPASRRPWVIAGGLLAAIAAAGAVNAGLALLAPAVNVPSDFRALNPRSYLLFTAIGVLLGALGWSWARKRSSKPGALLRWLVPAVVGASFIPDFFLLDEGGTMGVVTALLMHLVVAVIAIAAYRSIMPLAPVCGILKSS